MHSAPHVETIQVLDKAYPDGWRCGDRTTDAVTVILATGLRQMVEALLNGGGDRAR